jgi:hypothetical protein
MSSWNKGSWIFKSSIGTQNAQVVDKVSAISNPSDNSAPIEHNQRTGSGLDVQNIRDGQFGFDTVVNSTPTVNLTTS